MAIETLSEARSWSTPEAGPIVAAWLGRIDYGAAHALQQRLVAERAAGLIPDQLLLLEHPAVLTLGRQLGPGAHPRAPGGTGAAAASSVEHVERGGEVTYHGPGQLVAYPIIALHERGLLLRPLVRALEAALVETCAELGVTAARRDGHPGCWCDPDGPAPRKIGALGLRVERGVSYHGIALNVDGRPRRLRAHRPVRDARRGLDVDRRESCGDLDAPPTPASVERAGRAIFAGAFAADASTPPLDGSSDR